MVKYNFTYDLVFKAALEACPNAAIKLIKEFVHDLKDIPLDEEVTFLKQENIKGVDIKTTIFDVNLQIANNLVELEMQREVRNYDMKNRMLKYFSDMVSLSYEKGVDYNHKPCYSVWFLGFNLFNDNKSIHEIDLKDNINLKSFIEDAKIIVVEFEKFKDIDYNENRWYKLFKTNDLESLKGDDLIMNELADKIENLNNDEEFIIRIDAKERAEREYNARINADRKYILEEGLKEGLEKGMKQGIEEGMKQGIEEGMKQGIEEGMKQGIQQGQALGEKQKAKEIAKKLKAMGLSVDEIANATSLTKEEIESL